MDSVFLPSNLSSNKRQILLTISGGVFSIHLQLLFILFEIFEVWTDLFVQFSFTSHFFQNLLQTFWHIGNMNYHLRLSFEIWSKFLFYFQCLFILFGIFKMWTALIDQLQLSLTLFVLFEMWTIYSKILFPPFGR